MSGQHSPGPWVLHEDRVLVLSAGPNRQAVVDCETSCSPNLRKPEREANARLIAAAPELLEACKAIATHRWPDLTLLEQADRLDRAYAAIAKAEGRAV